MIAAFENTINGTYKNLNSNFILEDNEESYKLNLTKQNINWPYRTEQIVYKYNSYGHRCVELENLEKDYLLFAGCSHTEGVGLPLERTYCYQVAKHFNKSYYNLSVGGTGPDIVMLNIIGFFSMVKHRPSKVIIQWPDFHRFFHLNEDNTLKIYNPSCGTDDVYKILTINNYPFRQNILYRQLTIQYLKNIGIEEIYEFVHMTLLQDNLARNIHMCERIDKARDLSHCGIETHKLWAKTVISSLENF